ncbi:MAG: VCBS repeat-containing protein, partial [Chitinophagaceae bacterium]
MKFHRTSLTILASFTIILYSCTGKPARSWSVYLEDIGTYSSPRIADLNGDGIPDIVMGAGGQEGRPSAKAVIALDGYSGETLWVVPGINQVVGSPVFQDLNKDGTTDVIIGGRWAQLLAIDGKTGASIWSFYAERKSTD